MKWQSVSGVFFFFSFIVYMMLKNRYQNAVTTKNKIEHKEFFKQILSNFKEILLKRVRTLRTIHEIMGQKMKQSETEKKMGIIKMELDRKS